MARRKPPITFNRLGGEDIFTGLERAGSIPKGARPVPQQDRRLPFILELLRKKFGRG